MSREHGLVAFVLAKDMPTTSEEWAQVVAEQDRLFAVLDSHLSRHERLRAGRQLALDLNTATVFPTPPPEPWRDGADEGFYGTIETVRDWVAGLKPITAKIESNLHAALQRVTTIKPAKKRASVTRKSSRGAVLKEIEKGIANLDRWQKVAAIESPEGPQRIRGLAGSGKTVVLPSRPPIYTPSTQTGRSL